jgi:hypothetical protein
MARRTIIAAMGLVVILALVSWAQTNEGREGSPPPTMAMAPQPQPPVGPGPIPPMRMRELAEQLRARAREAQELSDRLRRQADELDQMAKRLMDRGPGPQQQGKFQPMPPCPRGDERPELKRQIERLRDEARRAKEQGRREDSERVWTEADRLEQVLREQGPRERGEFRGPMPPEVQDILRAAEQAEREGRLDEAHRQREKADTVARQLQEQRENRFGQPGPRGDERQEMKRKIGELRGDRMDNAQPMKKEKKQDRESPDGSFKDEIVRSMEGLKKEIGRLWQAVNEMRNRPREDRPI